MSKHNNCILYITTSSLNSYWLLLQHNIILCRVSLYGTKAIEYFCYSLHRFIFGGVVQHDT